MTNKTSDTGKSQRLEVVSNVIPQDRLPAHERRRRPRLNLSAEQFRLRANGKVFSVADLSIEGMALRVLDRNDFVVFPVATDIEGTLNLKGYKHDVQAKVRHLGPDLVGCEFTALDATVRAAIEKFLDPEVLGREIKPIPASDASTVWYHGPSGTDLLFWRGVDGQYKRMTLYVLGSFIQWDSETGLTTGSTKNSDAQSEVWGLVRFETMLMHEDSAPDPDKLKVAKALILSSNLPEDLKKWCCRHLEGK